MSSSGTNYARRAHSWMGILLFAVVLSLLSATPANAEDCVGDFGGLLDGNVTATAPSQLQIDGNCTIRNWPASKPLDTNISFLTQPGQTNQRWLVIYDNVVPTG